MEANPRHRGVIKRERVRTDDEPCLPAPGVRLVQLDEHTQAFEFTCACGEVSLIEIQYEAKS